MLSISQIDRLIEARAWPQLITRVLANGRTRDPRLADFLSQPPAAPIAALALSLQRSSELSYRPRSPIIAAAHALIARQRPDGLFGPLHAHALPLTSIAIRSLLALRDLGIDPQLIDPPLHHAIDALRAALADQPLATLPSLHNRIIRWQLARLSHEDLAPLRPHFSEAAPTSASATAA